MVLLYRWNGFASGFGREVSRTMGQMSRSLPYKKKKIFTSRECQIQTYTPIKKKKTSHLVFGEHLSYPYAYLHICPSHPDTRSWATDRHKFCIPPCTVPGYRRERVCTVLPLAVGIWQAAGGRPADPTTPRTVE